MKRLFYACVIAFLLLSVSVATNSIHYSKAYALSTPYAVIGEDVWMLSDGGDKLFLLPETYYARIDRMDDNFYHIQFNGVNGKVSKATVSVVGYDKPVKDTQKIIHVAQEYSVFTEIRLKTLLDKPDAESISVPTSEALTYTGTYKQGSSVWYYVSYGGQYGYILNTYTDCPEMPIEKFSPETQTDNEEETPEEESEEKQTDLVKILIIGGASAVMLIFVIVLFIPKKKKHKYYYS